VNSKKKCLNEDALDRQKKCKESIGSPSGNMQGKPVKKKGRARSKKITEGEAHQRNGELAFCDREMNRPYPN